MPPPRPVQSTDFEDYPQGAVPPPVRDADEYRDDRRLQELVAENARRLAESLRLYRPSPQQEKFHASRHRERVIRGGVRSGKSVGAACEIARALTGSDPHGKFPPRNGIAVAIGLDGGHCGKVMWKYLGGQGAFKIVRDQATGLWRTYCPRDPADALREIEVREAPALIPPRYVHKIAWDSRAKGIPRIIKFTTGWQLWFYSSMANVPRGFQADVCLAGWSEVYDPVVRKLRRIDEIDEAWHVLSYNQAAGRTEVRPASRPFIKSYGEICRVELSNDEVIYTTRRHQVLASSGQWISVGEAWSRATPLAHAGLCGAESRAAEVLAEQSPETCLPLWQSGQCSSRRNEQPAPGPSTSSALWRWSGQGCGAGCDHRELRKAPGCRDRCSSCRRRCGGQSLPAEEAGQASVPLQGCAPECSPRQLRLDGRAFSRERSRSCRTLARIAAWCRDLAVDHWAGFRYPSIEVCAEQPPGKREAVAGSRSTSCRGPHTFAALAPCRADVDALRACESECRPPSASDKWPAPRRGNVSLASAGCGSRAHKAETRLHGLATAEEAGDTSKAYKSPGLGFSGGIYIKNLSVVCQAPIWDISVPETHNYVYGGTISHNCWIDEEIANPDWFREMRARVIDRKGCLIWSATPQAGTECLYDLVCEAEKGNPHVLDVCLLTQENQYLAEESVRQFEYGMTDEERRVRMRGEFLLSGLLVYPEYRRGGLHAEPCFPIPHDWARYLAIDPGRQHCAVLFLAVPPPERGNVRYVYDECAIRNCDAELFAQEVAARSKGVVYEAGLIDMHAAGVVEMGSGRSVGEQYLEALKRHGVEFARGAGFVDGSGDAKEKAGVLAVRDWLRLRPDGSVKLKVMEEKCPRLVWEFERWRYTRDRDGSVKEVTEKRNSDSLDCLRYLCMYDPPYRRPKVRKGADSPAVRAMKAYKKKSRGAGGPCVSLGPRGAEA